MKKLISLILFVIFTISIAVAQSGLDVIKLMIEKNKQVKGLRYILIMQERIEGKFIKTKMLQKINTTPFKVYLKQDYPDKDLELLYVTGLNNGKARVKKNAIIKVSLDPYGSMIRKNQHNTVFNSGFNYTINIMEFLMKKYADKAEKMVINEGLVKVEDGSICYKLTLEDPDFKYINYTVKKGETLTSIAKKMYVSDYMILENNPKVDWFDDVEEGDVIKVPTVYAKKTILYIDKSVMLPTIIKIFDDKGLFEQYEFSKLQFNPTFTAEEFSQDNKNYGF